MDVDPSSTDVVVDRAIELKRERLIQSGLSQQEANRIIRQDESLNAGAD